MYKSAAQTTTPQKLAFLLLSLVITLLYLQYSHIFFCETIRFSAFVKTGKNLYVSKWIPMEDHQDIKGMLESAENRITGFWGDRKGTPVLIVCARPEEYERYCHSKEGAGCSLGTFYGSSFIVLNLHGLNTDVISHEMCHNELFERLGWRKTTFSVPQWFNEGLAMMLDHRFVNTSDSALRYRRYLREWKLRTLPPAKRLTLGEISSLNGFFNGDSRHVTLAYLTAASEVSYWLMIVGNQGLEEWLEAFSKGGSFSDSYYGTEISYAARRGIPPPANPIRRLGLQRPSE